MESSTQEISLQGKGGRIYDCMQRALHAVRIIDQNRNVYIFKYAD